MNKHTNRSWFALARHDEADQPPADPPADPPATGEKDWKAEAEKWKAMSRKNEDQAKANAEAARKLSEFESAQQTEAEKLVAKADSAEATARAVRAEVKALAEKFADRDDAVLNLGDLSQYVSDGDVDTDAISEALGKVLERKPHLARGPKNPAPDESQGRGGNNGPVDFRTVSKEEFDTELAKHGLRPRSYS
jgi:hypothetical protein